MRRQKHGNVRCCCPGGFLKSGLTQPKWRLVGPCAHHRHHQQHNDSKHLSSIFFVSLFLRFCCGDAFCTDTFLQTDDVTHRNLYTEQVLCADTLTHRGLCTGKLLHADALPHRLLRKEAFTHRRFYTPMLCTKMFLHALIKAHRRFYTQNLFYTEKPLRRTVFTQRSF